MSGAEIKKESYAAAELRRLGPGTGCTKRGSSNGELVAAAPLTGQQPRGV